MPRHLLHLFHLILQVSMETVRKYRSFLFGPFLFGPFLRRPFLFGPFLRGPFLLAQAATPLLKERGRGRIVNLASISGQTGGVSAGVHYSSSKGGLPSGRGPAT